MKLSVILPCFNGAQTIAVQLEALTRQDWRGGWEVIVVDNGSTDHSMSIVDRYRALLPDLQVVQAHVPGRPRLGVPHSYNTGIKAASGDAFVFCEADDEVAPGWLSAMGNALGAHGFVVARLEHRKLNAPDLHPLDGDGYQSVGLFPIPHAPHLYSASAAGFGLRRSVYEKVGPLNIDFPIVHDGEYCLRAQLAGVELHFEASAMVHYREKQDIASRFRQGRNWGLDTTRMYLHFGVPPKRFAVARQAIWIGRSLPTGLQAWLRLLTGRPQGRRLLADWVWNFGWDVGRYQALARNPVAARGTRDQRLLQMDTRAQASAE